MELTIIIFIISGGGGGTGGGGFDTQNNNNNTFSYTFHGDPKATFEQFFGTSNPFETFFNLGGNYFLLYLLTNLIIFSANFLYQFIVNAN